MTLLVTGGGGFLGEALVRRLVAGGASVRSFSRQHYPQLAALGVDQHQGDLADAAAVHRAVAGCELVFHTAAKAGVWGSYDSYFRPNVVGTRNLLSACRRQGVPRLIYTSSPSVVFTGGNMAGVDESLPYPPQYHTPYPATKAQAEREVLAANSQELLTVSLRPHLIWGPGDHHLVPRILARGRAGQLRRIGTGGNRVDSTYIDNAVAAHLAAAARLQPGAACAGRAYFIANDEPWPLWQLIDRMLAADGQPPVQRSLPAPLAYAIGALLETGYRLLRRRDEPRLTRFVARELATDHWFDLSAARRDLGYAPAVSVEQGLQRLQQWLATCAA